MENYCDIMPDATGWVYVLDGVQSPCAYYSYELALEAAQAQLARKGRGRLFRYQALNGEMLPVQAMSLARPPASMSF
ncbi:hypothetical protein E2F50_05595 [Rhizobium deserti]|uniref:DUF2188 domain-containing protein n=1 Tax=Rhizobium deserti TaxID=2547961 RepID=A0A4R5UNU8_9HYPH|nr:hypothetical protein [Rhizobium deserti]TDK39585.1 hypothetical protein E2F50_05595 [Rhizobium deserti]